MQRSSRTAFLACVTTVVSLVLAAAPVASQSSLAADAASSCPDVVYLAARGSGEHPLVGDKSWQDSTPSPYKTPLNGEGVRLFELGQLVKSAAAGQGLSFADYGIGVDEINKTVAGDNNYSADGVEELVPSSNEWNLLKRGDVLGFRNSWETNHFDPYIDSVTRGVNATVSAINHWEAVCPYAQLVLAGYSQGAMAVEQAEWEFSPAAMSHIAATVLLGNPDRIPNSLANQLGSAPPSGQGVATMFGLFNQEPQDVVDTVNVVDQNDIVGDTNLWSLVGHDSLSKIKAAFKNDMSVHSNYANTSKFKNATLDKSTGIYYGSTLASAVSFVNGRLNAIPSLLIYTSSIPEATVEVPYSESLTVQGGRPPYSWSLTSGTLPGNVVLGSDGTLSGTPTSEGAFPITVAVTDDRGTTTTQNLTLTVAAATPQSWQSSSIPHAQAITAITCNAARSCMATGMDDNSSGSVGTAYLLDQDQWTATALPSAPGAMAQNVTPNAVSCIDMSACVTVGVAGSIGPVGPGFLPAIGQGVISTLSNGNWTSIVAPAPAAAATVWVKPTSVSCSSSTRCVAVASYQSSNSSEPDPGYLLMSSGVGNWSAVVPPVPAGAPAGVLTLAGVRCVSNGNCYAPGTYRTDDGYYRAVMVTASASGVVSDFVDPPTNGVNPAGVDQDSDLLTGIDCMSATACFATGYFTDFANGYANGNRPFVARLTSNGWNSQQLPMPSAYLFFGGSLTGIACSTTQCAAYGSYFPTRDSYPVLLLESFEGGTWTAAPPPTAPTSVGTGNGYGYNSTYGIACGGSACLTTAQNYPPSGSEYGSGYDVGTVLIQGNADQWSATQAPTPGGQESPVVEAGVLACAGPTWCIAAGIYSDPVGGVTGLAETFGAG